MESKSCLKNIGVCVVKNWVWSLWSQDSEIGHISKKKDNNNNDNEINLLLAC